MQEPPWDNIPVGMGTGMGMGSWENGDRNGDRILGDLGQVHVGMGTGSFGDGDRILGDWGQDPGGFGTGMGDRILWEWGQDPGGMGTGMRTGSWGIGDRILWGWGQEWGTGSRGNGREGSAIPWGCSGGSAPAPSLSSNLSIPAWCCLAPGQLLIKSHFSFKWG